MKVVDQLEPLVRVARRRAQTVLPGVDAVIIGPGRFVMDQLVAELGGPPQELHGAPVVVPAVEPWFDEVLICMEPQDWGSQGGWFAPVLLSAWIEVDRYEKGQDSHWLKAAEAALQIRNPDPLRLTLKPSLAGVDP